MLLCACQPFNLRYLVVTCKVYFLLSNILLYITYAAVSLFSGREFPGHGNDHSYSVVKTDFSLLDADWSAEEEIQLMNALLTQGFNHFSRRKLEIVSDPQGT